MLEKKLEIIIIQETQDHEDVQINFPIRLSFTGNTAEAIERIQKSLKNKNRTPKLFFIIRLDHWTTDQQFDLTQFEEFSEVLSVIIAVDERQQRKEAIGKLFYVPKPLLTVVVSLLSIHYLKKEIEAERLLDRQDLVEIYSKNAETIKTWLIGNIQASPPHILIIPLNTSQENVENTIKSLERSCTHLGFNSTIIRTLSDYIPKTEIYDKLPYGKLYFQHESPTTVCRMLKELCPVRFYLLGNERTISSVWSKTMIAEETDQLTSDFTNEYDCYWFLEHEPIEESIKWDFQTRHGGNWKVKQIRPIQSSSVIENIFFRSALRRSHKSLGARQVRITAKLLIWHDVSRENKFLVDGGECRAVKLSDPMNQVEILLGFDDKSMKTQNVISEDIEIEWPIPTLLNLATSSLITSERSFLKRHYIWLGQDPSPDNRFRDAISPKSWEQYWSVPSYSSSLQRFNLAMNDEIILVLFSTFAREFFTVAHKIRKIKAIYIYAQNNGIFLEYLDQFPNICGIYPTLNSLFEQFQLDQELSSYAPSLNTNKEISFLPFNFLKDEDEITNQYQATMRSLSNVVPKPTREEFGKALEALSLQDKISPREKQAFLDTYQPEEAIRWYTRNGFLYQLINEALAHRNQEFIERYQVFISDLLRALNKLHETFLNNYDQNEDSPRLLVFRGQTLAIDQINRLKQNVGEHVIVNSFMSTTTSSNVAAMFTGADSPLTSESEIPILFAFDIDITKRYNSSFASIVSQSQHKDEEEYLFSMGSIFFVSDVKKSSEHHNIFFAQLRMVDQMQSDHFFSDMLDEKLNYCIALREDLAETIEQFDGLVKVLRESNVTLCNVRQITDSDNSESDDQRDVCFVLPHQCRFSNKHKRSNEIYYDSADVHLNDVIFIVIGDMQKKMRTINAKKLHEGFTNLYKPKFGNELYIQLLQTAHYRESEKRFADQFPSLQNICFYRKDSCLSFIEMINPEGFDLQIILLIQSDDPQIDGLIEKFEKFRVIKYVHICTKCKSFVRNRRIIQSVSFTENHFYQELIADHAMISSRHARDHIEVHKNRQQALRYVDETEIYEQLLHQYNPFNTYTKSIHNQ